MIKNTMHLFFHSVDRDIETLEAQNAPASILDKLRGMQDTIRSKWASIYSNEKRDVANTVENYLELNVEINNVYNSIVAERSNYLLDNNIEDIEPVDEYILTELFLSYTIFIDAYSEMGFYYVLCGNFPIHDMAFFVRQRQMREANRSQNG